jgi:hypothetical protein
LDTAEAIIANPESYDSKREFVRNGQKMVSYAKNIYQGSSIRYNMDNI